MTRRFGSVFRKDSATSAVRSFEPSSTTRISVSSPKFGRKAAIRSRVAGRRNSSLYDGITMERLGAPELIAPAVPSIHDSQSAVRSGTPPGCAFRKNCHAVPGKAILGCPRLPPAKSSGPPPRAENEAVPARRALPRRRGWHQTEQNQGAPECHRHSEREHCHIRDAQAALLRKQPVPSATRC